jgi:hypothetical protein
VAVAALGEAIGGNGRTWGRRRCSGSRSGQRRWWGRWRGPAGGAGPGGAAGAGDRSPGREKGENEPTRADPCS